MASNGTNILVKTYRSAIWRLIAVAVCVVWTTLFLARFLFFELDTYKQDFLTMPVYIVLYGMTILASVLLIVFPLKLRVYVFLWCLWGLVHLIEGRSILGSVEYMLGCMFAYHLGFFRKLPRIKTSVALAILLTAIAIQISYHFSLWVEILLWYLEFLLTVSIVAIVFSPEIHKIQAERRESIMRLAVPDFSEQDADILQKVLAGEKYETIAKAVNMTMPTFHRCIRQLYAKIGVGDRTSFLLRYVGYTVMLQTLPPIENQHT